MKSRRNRSEMLSSLHKSVVSKASSALFTFWATMSDEWK